MPSDEVIVAIVSTFGIIMTGLLTYLGIVVTVTRKHAKAARFGVENAHPTNLRDDLDEKFHGLAEMVKELIRDVGGMKSDIRQIHREASEDRTALALERERIRKLEASKAVEVAAVAAALEASTTITTKPKEKL